MRASERETERDTEICDELAFSLDRSREMIDSAVWTLRLGSCVGVRGERLQHVDSSQRQKGAAAQERRSAGAQERSAIVVVMSLSLSVTRDVPTDEQITKAFIRCDNVT